MLTNAQLTWRTASLSKRRPQQREEILCWRQEGRLKHWLLCNCRRKRGRGGERGGNSQNTVVAYREESCCKQTHHSIPAQWREEEEDCRRRGVEEEEEEQADMEKRRKRSTRNTWRKVEEEGRRCRMNQRICVDKKLPLASMRHSCLLTWMHLTSSDGYQHNLCPSYRLSPTKSVFLHSVVKNGLIMHALF